MRLATCAFLCFAAATQAFGQVYVDPFVSATADAQASFSTGLISFDPFVEHSFSTGNLPVPTSLSAEARANVDEERDDDFGLHYHVVSTADFLATPGVLHGRVGSMVSLSDDGTLSSFARSSSSGLLANPGTQFADTFTVTGPGVGSIIPVTVTMVFEGIASSATDDPSAGSITSQGSLQVTSTADGQSGTLSVSTLVNQVDTFHLVSTFTTMATVGTPFQIFGSLFANTVAYRDGVAGSTQADFNASNTGSVSVVVPTGYTFTTASGYRYQAVPEPSTLLFLIAGAAAFALRRSGKH